MKQFILFVACAVCASVAWAGGPTFYVPIDIDLIGNAVPDCPPWLTPEFSCTYVTTSDIKSIMTRGGTKTTLRIPQFWDGNGAELRFVIMGAPPQGGVEPPPGTEYRLGLSVYSDEPGSTPVYQRRIDVPYSTGWEVVEVILNLDDFFDDGHLTPGGQYRLELSPTFFHWDGFRYLGSVTFSFPVTLPFVFENGFESGNAAYWSEVMVR